MLCKCIRIEAVGACSDRTCTTLRTVIVVSEGAVVVDRGPRGGGGGEGQLLGVLLGQGCGVVSLIGTVGIWCRGRGGLLVGAVGGTRAVVYMRTVMVGARGLAVGVGVGAGGMHV